MRRAFAILLLAFSAPAWPASSAGAQVPPPPEERIRAGVTVSGVDVGNLTVPEATVKLEQTLGPVLAQDVVVRRCTPAAPYRRRQTARSRPRRPRRR